jgi:hypothetical protein
MSRSFMCETNLERSIVAKSPYRSSSGGQNVYRHDSNLARWERHSKDNRVRKNRFEMFLASGIYVLTGISAINVFSVGLANGVASGYHYPVRQELLIGAALGGAATLLFSAIFVHFHPIASYRIASGATLLLWLGCLPLIEIITLVIVFHPEMLVRGDGPNHEIVLVLLLSVATIFSVRRLLKSTRSWR